MINKIVCDNRQTLPPVADSRQHRFPYITEIVCLYDWIAFQLDTVEH